ncbi:MAG TPA: hypothetical protein VGJ95_02740 [Pseudonocardiaceae bacterium]
MHRLSKLVGGVAWFAALSGALVACGGQAATVSETAGTPSVAVARSEPSDGSVLLRYELTGTSVIIDGNYAEPADGKEKMVELHATPLPWRKSFTLPPKQFFVAGLVAHGPNLESTVTCKIMKDSETIALQTGPMVDCRAEIS